MTGDAYRTPHPRPPAPSRYPGLKLLVEWPDSEHARRDKRTRFLCPGCDTHVSWFCDGSTTDVVQRERWNRCKYASEHAAMHRFFRVACVKRFERLRFIGWHRGVDADLRDDHYRRDQIGWVGVLDRFEYPHRAAVFTQECEVWAPMECWEQAPGAPLGALGGPLEHSIERSYFADTVRWKLGVIARDALKLRATGMSLPTSLREARVEFDDWLAKDRAWSAEQAALRAKKAQEE